MTHTTIRTAQHNYRVVVRLRTYLTEISFERRREEKSPGVVQAYSYEEEEGKFGLNVPSSSCNSDLPSMLELFKRLTTVDIAKKSAYSKQDRSSFWSYMVLTKHMMSSNSNSSNSSSSSSNNSNSYSFQMNLLLAQAVDDDLASAAAVVAA